MADKEAAEAALNALLEVQKCYFMYTVNMR